tara:strand:- start:457 stop:642 length:186 start_codon:yes stop_codon:yes gene_type:complete
MGIHYDYKSKRGERAMLKEAKRKARLAQKKAKKAPLKQEQEAEALDIEKTITLDDLTNPNK